MKIMQGYKGYRGYVGSPIPLLGQGYLGQVYRHKAVMLTEIEKRKALFLTCCITAVVTFGVIMFLVRS